MATKNLNYERGYELMRLKKKLLGIILSLVLALGLMPRMSMTAYAAEYTSLSVGDVIKVGDSFTPSDNIIEVATGGGNAYMLIADYGDYPLTLVRANVVEVTDEEGGTKSTVTESETGGYYVFRHRGNRYVTNTEWVVSGKTDGLVLDSIGTYQYYSRTDPLYTFSVHEATVAVTGVSLNKTTTTLTVGDKETLTATVSPDNASNKSVTWSSDNTSVATVDANGNVTAVSSGTANITVTTTDGSKTASCAVTVIAPSSGGDSSDSGSGGSSDSGSTSGGSSDSGSSSGSSSSSNTSSGTSSSSSSSTSTSTPAPATVPYDKVVISTGAVNDITGTAAATAESNPFGTKIENNDNLTTLLSLTPEEVAQGVNVWLDIQDMSATVPQAEKDIVQNASANFTVGMYLDINLFKKVGGNATTKITETNGTVKASILIPESLWKAGRTFEIIRVHDGVPTVISGTYDENTHVFTFETDKFSTYALAYNDSANSTQSTAPRTGDNNHLGVWYLLLAVSLGGLGYLGYTKKKRVNK